MGRCVSCGAEADVSATYCPKCIDVAWERNGKPWRALFSRDARLALGNGVPELTTWCYWGKIWHEKGEMSGAATAGAVIGGLIGGGIGGAVGGAIGGAVNKAVEGSAREESFAGSGYTASMGIVALTETEVLVVDCGRTCPISEFGLLSDDVESQIAEDRQKGRLNPRMFRARRDDVRAILRHEGSTLQLSGLGQETWLPTGGKFFRSWKDEDLTDLQSNR